MSVGKRWSELLGGLMAAFVVFVAVPTVFATLIGVPLPRHPTAATMLSARGLFDLLAIVAWVAWLECCWSLLRTVTARVRSHDLHASPGIAEWLAARIAGAVLILASLGVNAAVASASPIAHASTPVIVEHLRALPPGPALVAHAVETYTVVTGDSLWSIAASRYGTGSQWPLLAKANVGLPMGGGTRMMDPDLIRPGWVLQVPDPEAASVVAVPPPVKIRHPAVRHVDTLSRLPQGPAMRARPPARPVPGRPVPLPELLALGCGVVVAAGLARRARRNRRREARDLSERAIEMGMAVSRFESTPLLEWTELAVRHLSTAASEKPLLIRSGPDGLEVWFEEPGEPFGGWAQRGRTSWQLPSSMTTRELKSDCEDATPLTPILLPVGDDDAGSWFVPLAPGESATIVGPAAMRLRAAMVRGLEGWQWAESVVVTEDRRRLDDGRWRLFIGDADDLTEDELEQCAVLTTRTSTRSRLTLVVDEEAVTLHPLGLTLRPHLIDRETDRAIEELVEPDPQNGVASVVDVATELAVAMSTAPIVITERVRPDSVRAHNQATPGSIEVKLLTAIPRIEGLVDELDSKLARRAIEVVAYLAMHHPDPVTADRLRTRVLGSGESDAAARTLQNTVSAARRAMGWTEDGELHLPPATKGGLYKTAASVTVDALRAIELVAHASKSDDPNYEMANLRQALELIESQPRQSMVVGYDWWDVEGFERRVANALTGAACRMVDLALSDGWTDLAKWGLDRARLVDPWSESLTRAGMRLASAIGDTDGLRREWTDCLRRAEELDPGGSPAEKTERLYAELRRQEAVGI